MNKRTNAPRKAQTTSRRARTTQPQPRIQVRGNEVAPFISVRAPQLTSAGNSVRIRNRQIYGEIAGIATDGVIPYGSQQLIWNFFLPSGADPGPYPFASDSWLGRIANNYDKYKVFNLQFMFQPLLPVTTGGAVGMYWDEDPLDIPLDYSTLASNYKATTGSIFETVTLNVTRDQLNRLPYYLTRSSGVEKPSITSSAVGQQQVAWTSIELANSSLSGGVIIGYVWVEYDIEFANPTYP